MNVLRVDPERPDPVAIARAAAVLRDGGLVAFPTETVYGLGADALDEAAVLRIFAAKGRPRFNPLIAHVRSADGARELVEAWPALAGRLAAEFWPGPLTLVLRRRAAVPDVVSAGLPTLAVRMPNHPVALALLDAVGVPLAAPSANRYTRTSPTTAAHVARSLGERVDLILDGGPTRVGIESTVVDLSAERPRLLRPGSLSRDRIAAIIGPLDDAAPPSAEDVPRASPGMVGRHYAPNAEIRLFERSDTDAIVALVEHTRRAGGTVGGLLRHPMAAPFARVIVMPDDAAAFAGRLYAALHELDDAGCSLILVETVPEGDEWEGVRDRLARAASPA